MMYGFWFQQHTSPVLLEVFRCPHFRTRTLRSPPPGTMCSPISGQSWSQKRTPTGHTPASHALTTATLLASCCAATWARWRDLPQAGGYSFMKVRMDTLGTDAHRRRFTPHRPTPLSTFGRSTCKITPCRVMQIAKTHANLRMRKKSADVA